MISNGEPQVRDGYHYGYLVSGDQQAHQASLKDVGREEGEENDDEGEDKTNILDTESI